MFLDGKLVEDLKLNRIAEELGALIDAEPNPKMVLDFAGVEQLSSMALGTLITINTKIESRQGQLKLAGLAPRIREVFVISGLDSLFDIHRSFDGAKASMD